MADAGERQKNIFGKSDFPWLHTVPFLFEHVKISG
jgi:hypothetical protein